MGPCESPARPPPRGVLACVDEQSHVLCEIGKGGDKDTAEGTPLFASVHDFAAAHVHELEALVDDGADPIEVVRAEGLEHFAQIRSRDGLGHVAMLLRRGNGTSGMPPLCCRSAAAATQGRESGHKKFRCASVRECHPTALSSHRAFRLSSPRVIAAPPLHVPADENPDGAKDNG